MERNRKRILNLLDRNTARLCYQRRNGLSRINVAQHDKRRARIFRAAATVGVQ